MPRSWTFLRGIPASTVVGIYAVSLTRSREPALAGGTQQDWERMGYSKTRLYPVSAVNLPARGTGLPRMRLIQTPSCAASASCMIFDTVDALSAEYARRAPASSAARSLARAYRAAASGWARR